MFAFAPSKRREREGGRRDRKIRREGFGHTFMYACVAGVICIVYAKG